MVIIIGFILLFLLLLGAALFLLSIIFLGIGVGIQLFGVAVGSNAVWIPTLATNVELAAGSAFALGVVLAIIGLSAFLFPAVRVFLKGLILLFRIALSPVFTQLLQSLPQALGTIALLLENAGKLL